MIFNLFSVNSSPKQQKKKISKSNSQNTQDFLSVETPAAGSSQAESKAKKKTKFVNLYSQEGKKAQVVLLKG